ncbi:MAG: TRAP transporter small permease subunit [Terasakiella sp.]|uniref:TRAP transporter small permease subunit n=1 Tax=unclassified Terasakiella TaxID=2614952 RepID=UPI003AFFAC0A
MKSIAYFITSVNRFFFQSAKWIIFLIVPIMLLEVVSRYVFDSSTIWASELATLLFGPYFLLGGPYLLYLGGHVAVDLLKDRAGPRLTFCMELVGLMMGGVFAVILTVYSTGQAYNSFLLNETSFSTWNPQIWPFKIFLPIASCLLVGQILANLVFLFSHETRQEETV